MKYVRAFTLIHNYLNKNMSTNIKTNLPLEKFIFNNPSLEEIAQALEKGLSKRFQSAKVSIVDCPDLTKAPFNFPSVGICGKSCIADIGGVPYLLPKYQPDHVYNIEELTNYMAEFDKKENNDVYIYGAGSGPFHKIGTNSEMICHVKINNELGKEQQINISTTLATALPNNDVKIQTSPSADCSLLANLSFCNGQSGKVLEVICSKRTSDDNIMIALRNSLNETYPNTAIGLAGTFCVETGKVKIHVMPEFSKKAISCEQDLNEWLQFYTVDGPFTAVGWLVSSDPGFDLRTEHFHGVGEKKISAGHYHYDESPDDVSYRCYFTVPDCLYRIDRPKETHSFGRN